MQDGIQFAGYRNEFRNILFDKTEILVPGQAGQVIRITCDEVVHPNQFVAFGKQPVTKVGTQKTGCSCDENAHELLLDLIRRSSTPTEVGFTSNLSGWSTHPR